MDQSYLGAVAEDAERGAEDHCHHTCSWPVLACHQCVISLVRRQRGRRRTNFPEETVARAEHAYGADLATTCCVSPRTHTASLPYVRHLGQNQTWQCS